MVLDTYRPDEELFIFKNTYNDEINGQPKQFKIGRNDENAPEELFFVHIDVRDMDNLPSLCASIDDKTRKTQDMVIFKVVLRYLATLVFFVAIASKCSARFFAFCMEKSCINLSAIQPLLPRNLQ